MSGEHFHEEGAATVNVRFSRRLGITSFPLAVDQRWLFMQETRSSESSV